MIKVYFDSRRCLGCHSCELVCAVEHSESRDLCGALLEEERPVPRRNVRIVEGSCLTVACRQCDPAPCVEACMAGAMQKDPETGTVKCNIDKCVGCWMCVMVCPFDAVQPGKLYTIKCDACEHLEGAYACVDACPTMALFAVESNEFKEIMRARREREKAEMKT